MSYILDALRKADAQRERDASRGIHAQAPSIGAATHESDSGSGMGRLALLAAGVVLAAVGGWYLTQGEPAAVAAPQQPVASAQSPPAAAAILPPPPAPVAAPPMAPSPTAQTAPAAPIAGGLPPDAPRVAISGGVYSPNVAQRMLIVNGQVFNEGSEVAPGVKVEAIQSRTAVLSFRGSRYTVAY